jgi:hypothetical protein
MRSLSDEELRTRLIDALESSDALRRGARADRLIWLSNHNSHPTAIAGEADSLRMLDEARICFGDGLFVAVLLLAVSFIEQTVADELIERRLAKAGDPLNQMNVAARNNKVFPEAMLASAEKLRRIRNAYTHRKHPGHDLNFGNRFRSGGRHPVAVLEADAQEAMILMYEFLRATLKYIKF